MPRHPLSVMIATVGGLGLVTRRMAPGTWGSIAACLVDAVVPISWWAIVAVTLIGVWASGEAERILGEPDPGSVIIDEVVGMWLSTFLLPRSWLLPGLVLFRVVDIFKPFPVRAAEKIPGGWGIMLDDIVGGAMVNVALHAALAYLHEEGWICALLSWL